MHTLIKSFFIALLLGISTLIPSVVFAQSNTGVDYEPLVEVPLPGVEEGDNSFTGYLNGLFTFAIGIAVALAVLMVALGGVRYMSTDAVSGKREGLSMVNAAIGGIILILLSWLILRTINPGLLSISFGGEGRLQGFTAEDFDGNELLGLTPSELRAEMIYQNQIDALLASHTESGAAADYLMNKYTEFKEKAQEARVNNLSNLAAEYEKAAETVYGEAQILKSTNNMYTRIESGLAYMEKELQEGAPRTRVEAYENDVFISNINSIKFERKELVNKIKQYNGAGKLSVQEIESTLRGYEGDFIRYGRDYIAYRKECRTNTTVKVVSGSGGVGGQPNMIDVPCTYVSAAGTTLGKPTPPTIIKLTVDNFSTVTK